MFLLIGVMKALDHARTRPLRAAVIRRSVNVAIMTSTLSLRHPKYSNQHVVFTDPEGLSFTTCGVKFSSVPAVAVATRPFSASEASGGSRCGYFEVTIVDVGQPIQDEGTAYHLISVGLVANVPLPGGGIAVNAGRTPWVLVVGATDSSYGYHNDGDLWYSREKEDANRRHRAASMIPCGRIYHTGDIVGVRIAVTRGHVACGLD